MNLTIPKRWVFLKYLILIPAFFISYATIASASGEIKEARSFNDEQKTRIIFESDVPLVYSAYTTPEKASLLVIDFPDVSLGDVPKIINVLTPEVKSVQFNNIPIESGTYITRAEIQMTSDLSYHISQHRNFMYIDFTKNDSSATSSEKDTANNTDRLLVSRQTNDKKTSLSNPDVNIPDFSVSSEGETSTDSDTKIFDSITLPYHLKEITYDVKGLENITVNLICEGTPEYSSFELQSPDRLIVDFHKTINKSYPRSVSLNLNNVKRIRTAQFQTNPVNITRVVFDVTQPINYRIMRDGVNLKVAFGDTAYLDAEQASIQKPEPAPIKNTQVIPKDVTVVNSDSYNDNSTGDKATASSTKRIQTTDISDEDISTAEHVKIESKSKSIKNEPVGKVDVELFETANPGTSPPPLLGQQEDSSPTYENQPDTTKLYTDSYFEKKLVTEGSKYTGEKISMRFKDADIKDVIQILGDVTGKNFIVDERVRGKVTINFTDVPWDQALDIILSLNNLGMVEENNVIIVASMAKLEEKARKERELEEERVLSGPVDVITRRVSYAKADDVANIVKSYLTRRGNIIVDKRTNLLLIRELRAKIQTILDLIDQLDIPTRQVNIESRIIETTRNYEKDLGIQWGWQAIADEEHGNATRYIWPHDITVQGSTINTGISGVPYAVNIPPASPTSGIALSMGNVLDTLRLDAALQAMEEDGYGKILATPSVSTQNNIEAVISSGAKIPYTSIVDNTASVTFIQAKLELKVTPQITSDNTIIMEIKVEKTEPDYSRLITNVQGALPTILEKKAESTMLVKDGGTAVIGGILQINDSEAERRTPFFHKIPLVGWLFTAHNWKRTDSELLIFITPKILGYN